MVVLVVRDAEAKGVRDKQNRWGPCCRRASDVGFEVSKLFGLALQLSLLDCSDTAWLVMRCHFGARSQNGVLPSSNVPHNWVKLDAVWSS